jgi:hypothetical protein
MVILWDDDTRGMVRAPSLCDRADAPTLDPTGPSAPSARGQREANAPAPGDGWRREADTDTRAGPVLAALGGYGV